MSEQTLKELWDSLEDKQTPLCHRSFRTDYYVMFYFQANDASAEYTATESYLYGIDNYSDFYETLSDSKGWKIYKEPKKKIKVYCPFTYMESGVVYLYTGLRYNRPLRCTKDKRLFFEYPDNIRVIRWHEEEVYENFDNQEEAE